MDMQDYFVALDDLRKSGTMNMFGAPRWLEDSFGLSRKEARAIFSQWCARCEADEKERGTS